MDHGVLFRAPSDDHPLNAGVDDEPPAHGAGGSIGEEFAGLGVPASQVEGGAQGGAAGGRDNAVGLGMDRAAQFIPLTRGHSELLPGTAAQIGAVFPSPGGSIVASGKDLIILHDDGAIAPPQTGGALEHRIRNIQIVIFLVDPGHSRRLLCFFLQYTGFVPTAQEKLPLGHRPDSPCRKADTPKHRSPPAPFFPYFYGVHGTIHTLFTFAFLTSTHPAAMINT